MKSINDNPFLIQNPEFFSEQTIYHLISEGFRWGDNSSVINSYEDRSGNANPNFEPTCMKLTGEKDYFDNTIDIYVFKSGIGVDVARNIEQSKFFPYGKNFADTYDQMVAFVATLKYNL